LAHAEADTFWLFEAMIGEFSDLLEDDGCNLWMRRFSEQVALTDDELFTDLVRFVTLSRLPSSPTPNYRSPED
jgi:hypothetical protein